MRVTFLGTGSAMPQPERVQTGLLLEAAAGDERPLLVDCGAGVLHRLSQTDPGYEAVSTVLLTHHHLDHVADLLPLLKARWLAGAEHLQVVGPAGTKELLDDMLAVHDYLDGRIDLSVREIHPDERIELAGLAVESYQTRHSVDCLAYRFEPLDGENPVADDETSGGTETTPAAEPPVEPGAFVFSGDSEAFPGLASFADGARVLAHDCPFPYFRATRYSRTYSADPISPASGMCSCITTGCSVCVVCPAQRDDRGTKGCFCWRYLLDAVGSCMSRLNALRTLCVV